MSKRYIHEEYKKMISRSRGFVFLVEFHEFDHVTAKLKLIKNEFEEQMSSKYIMPL